MLAINAPLQPRIASKLAPTKKQAGMIDPIEQASSSRRHLQICGNPRSPVGASLLAINAPSMSQTNGSFNRRSLSGAAADEGHQGCEAAARGDGQW